MASGWGWFFLALCFSSIFLHSVKATHTVLTVTEGESFNISCNYPLPGHWQIFPQLINTQGQASCTDDISVLSYQCHIYNAQLTDTGTYNFSIRPTSDAGSEIQPCSVQIIVQPLHTEESSSSTSSSEVTLLPPTKSTISTSSNTVTVHATTTLSSSIIVSTTSISTSTTNIATTASSSISVVPIIVPVVIVGLLLSTSLIILSIAVICVMKLRKKRPVDTEGSDTGFLLGKERNELFNDPSADGGELSQTIPFTFILFQELVSKNGPLLVHHASIKRKDVLVKQLKDKRGREELLHEISILKNISDHNDDSHPNIMSFIGTTNSPDPLCLVVEYLPHGSLHDILQSLHKGPIPSWYIEHVLSSPRGLYNNKQISDDLFSILLQVSKGAQYLAEHGLVHGHVSTKNIMLGKNLVAKLGNFTILKSGEYFIKSEREIFLQDLAPEVISEGEHTTKSDIWSFGVMIYRVATFESREPFKKISPSAIQANILQGTRPPPLPCFSKELYFQMQQCWKTNPEERPDFKQLHHTLEILGQSSWSHLLFEISEKRKGYVSENHQIYLFPSQQTAAAGNAARRLLSRPSFVTDDTSGLASSVMDSGEDTDHQPSSRSKLKWLKRKPSGDKISSSPSSRLLQSQKASQKSLIEDFERNLLMSTQQVSRNNPLANTL